MGIMNKKLIFFMSLFVVLSFKFFNDKNSKNLENKDEVYYINNDISLNSSYSREFSVSKDNSDLLNISVDNTGKNDVYIDFYKNNKSIISDVAINKGENFTKEFNSNDFKLSGKFKIYLYTKDGSRMNANINVIKK